MLRYLFILPRYFIRHIYVYYNLIKIKISGACVGNNCRIFQSFYVLIKKGGLCNIGNNFTLQSGSCFNPLVRGSKASIYVGAEGKLTIGNDTGISASCIWCVDNISIGNHVDIGANCVIIDNDAHSLDYRLRRDSYKDISNSKPIVIEDDVLIGTNCIILKGVKIGSRSVIGAGSVVTGDIPTDCIAVGNPCKIIKTLKYE